MHGVLKLADLISTQTHLQKGGFSWGHVSAELQNVNNGYRVGVFVSGGNIGERANDNSFRLDLRKGGHLDLGGSQMRKGAN